MMPVVCAWHEHHERAASALNERLDKRQTMVIPAPSLIESYAVLTRLPPPHRLSPSDARDVLDANFARGRSIIALDGSEYADLLRWAPDAPVVGGRAYDAVVARCAAKGRVSALLTFNDKHFNSFTVDFDVVVP
jgi:predicted nucleic acid-binding protein